MLDQSVDVAVVPEDTPVPQSAAPLPVSTPAPLVEQELLVEDVSIDGMCGVY